MIRVFVNSDPAQEANWLKSNGPVGVTFWRKMMEDFLARQQEQRSKNCSSTWLCWVWRYIAKKSKISSLLWINVEKKLHLLTEKNDFIFSQKCIWYSFLKGVDRFSWKVTKRSRLGKYLSSESFTELAISIQATLTRIYVMCFANLKLNPKD